MGRHRKPIEIKEREGIRVQPCRTVIANLPKPSHARPLPLEKLTAAKAKLWSQFCQTLEELGVLAVTDIWLIQELVNTKNELDEARAALKKRGSISYLSPTTGGWKPFPEVGTVADRARHFMALLAKAGLTPVDRMRVSVAPREQQSDALDFLDA